MTSLLGSKRPRTSRPPLRDDVPPRIKTLPALLVATALRRRAARGHAPPTPRRSGAATRVNSSAAFPVATALLVATALRRRAARGHASPGAPTERGGYKETCSCTITDHTLNGHRTKRLFNSLITGRVSVVTGAAHAVTGSMFTAPGAAHAVTGSMFAAPGAAHAVTGSVFTMTGAAHAVSGSVFAVSGSGLILIGPAPRIVGSAWMRLGLSPPPPAATRPGGGTWRWNRDFVIAGFRRLSTSRTTLVA